MTRPAPCQMAAITMVKIAMRWLTIQSKVKLAKPRSRTTSWMPMPGLKIQRQTSPTTMKEVA